VLRPGVLNELLGVSLTLFFISPRRLGKRIELNMVLTAQVPRVAPPAHRKATFQYSILAGITDNNNNNNNNIIV